MATTPRPAQSSTTSTSAPMSTKSVMAVLVAWLFVVFDGYDLIVYGTVTGALMDEWNLNPGQAGTIGSKLSCQAATVEGAVGARLASFHMCLMMTLAS